MKFQTFLVISSLFVSADAAVRLRGGGTDESNVGFAAPATTTTIVNNKYLKLANEFAEATMGKEKLRQLQAAQGGDDQEAADQERSARELQASMSHSMSYSMSM